MASPALLVVAPCSHAFCTRSMFACSTSTSCEAGLARRLSVHLRLNHRSPRGKSDSQAGICRHPAFSAFPTSSKAPMVRAAISDEAGVAEPARAAEEPAGQLAANQDTVSTAKVTFQLKHEVHFGQEFRVVGSSSELGQWDLQAALPLTWTEGHVWKAEKAVGVGKTVEYKFVITNSDGRVEWQPGENRMFEIKDANDLMISVPWNASKEVGPEAVPEVTADLPPEAIAGFDNGVAPGTDAVEGIVTLGGMVADNVKKSVGNLRPSVTEKVEDAIEKNGDEGEPSEIPAVDAIVAAAVAEASEPADELATQSNEIAKLSQAEADDRSSGSLLSQQKGIEESPPETELVFDETPAEVDEMKVDSHGPLSSPIAILDNDLRWSTQAFSRIIGPKAKRTKP